MARYEFQDLPIINAVQFEEDGTIRIDGVGSFNSTLWSDKEEIADVVALLLDEYELKNNIRTRNLREQYGNTLTILTCNFVVCIKSKKEFLATPLGSKNFLEKIEKYQPIKITRTKFNNLIDWLADEGYINLYVAPAIGAISYSSVTQILQPARDLIDEYGLHPGHVFYHEDYRFVHKKNDHKNLIDYQDDNETAYREKVLKDYNAMLSRAEISIDDKPISKPVGLSSTIYGDSSYGRINGGEWMYCKSKKRSTIKIDGEQTIEIDVSNCTLRIAANLNKWDIPEHADLYQIEGVPRQVVKNIAQIMQNISAKSVKDGLNKVTGALLEKYVKEKTESYINRLISKGATPAEAQRQAKKLKTHIQTNQNNKEEMLSNGIPYDRKEMRAIVEQVYDFHKIFASGWLMCGRGMELMFIESKIAFKVIEQFITLNEVVLTVHDSFITKASNKQLLERILNESYKSYTCYSPKLLYKT